MKRPRSEQADGGTAGGIMGVWYTDRNQLCQGRVSKAKKSRIRTPPIKKKGKRRRAWGAKHADHTHDKDPGRGLT